MLIVALILRVGDDHLRMLCTKDCDQAIHRLIVGGDREAVGVEVGVAVRHAGISIAEHVNDVVADDRSGPIELLTADLLKVVDDLRTVHRRVENVALLTPGAAHQHRANSLGPVFRDGAGSFDASSSGWACTVRTQSGSVMQRTILSLGDYRFELHLAVTIGVDEDPAEATGQEFAAFIGATCDDLVTGQQPHPAARTVAVPAAATNGEHGETGFDVELEFGECPTVGLAVGTDRHLDDDLVGITEGSPRIGWTSSSCSMSQTIACA